MFSKLRASSEKRMFCVVVCGFPQNLRLSGSFYRRKEAIHVNRNRFGTESNLIYRIEETGGTKSVLSAEF